MLAAVQFYFTYPETAGKTLVRLRPASRRDDQMVTYVRRRRLRHCSPLAARSRGRRRRESRVLTPWSRRRRKGGTRWTILRTTGRCPCRRVPRRMCTRMLVDASIQGLAVCYRSEIRCCWWVRGGSSPEVGESLGRGMQPSAQIYALSLKCSQYNDIAS